jgi:hypothetical protein
LDSCGEDRGPEIRLPNAAATAAHLPRSTCEGGEETGVSYCDALLPAREPAFFNGSLILATEKDRSGEERATRSFLSARRSHG